MARRSVQVATGISGVASVLLIGVFWRDICEIIAELADEVLMDFDHNRG